MMYICNSVRMPFTFPRGIAMTGSLCLCMCVCDLCLINDLTV